MDLLLRLSPFSVIHPPRRPHRRTSPPPPAPATTSARRTENEARQFVAVDQGADAARAPSPVRSCPAAAVGNAPAATASGSGGGGAAPAAPPSGGRRPRPSPGAKERRREEAERTRRQRSGHDPGDESREEPTGGQSLRQSAARRGEGGEARLAGGPLRKPPEDNAPSPSSPSLFPRVLRRPSRPRTILRD